VRVQALDGVLFTHDHAEHTHGIDDLRMVAFAMKRRIDCYFDAPTRSSIETRFAYCFKSPQGLGYPPILNAKDIVPGQPVVIEGTGGRIEALPIPQLHGDLPSLGFRVGGLAYSPDLSDVPTESVPLLEGLDVWIVDALRYTTHSSHFHLKRALEWIARVKAKRAVLTHMTNELDYEALRRELPPHIEPAYDGMVIEF
jgi:phosphoribosyl 1,2-cyclic phosphate phosphodiesterase